MKKSIDIIYHKVPMNVSGEWIPFQPAVLRADPLESRPPEGGYFSDYTITIGDVDATSALFNSRSIADYAAMKIMEVEDGR